MVSRQPQRRCGRMASNAFDYHGLVAGATLARNLPSGAARRSSGLGCTLFDLRAMFLISEQRSPGHITDFGCRQPNAIHAHERLATRAAGLYRHPAFGDLRSRLANASASLYFTRWGLNVTVMPDGAHRVFLIVLKLPFEPSTCYSTSKERMWVAMRSRNQRSWLIDHGAAGKNPPAPLRASACCVSDVEIVVGS